MGIKSLLKKIIKSIAFGFYDSDSYISYLREKGITIGDNCKFFAPNTICIDLTRPYGITIGNNVIITQGVSILTHGFDWSVLKHEHSVILGSFKPVKIDNNVFIGVNSTILGGVNIGSNVIIGAGSVITKDLDGGFVYAGNPAKKIMTIDDYFDKRLKCQIIECKSQIEAYYKKFNVAPPETELSEFFYLFSNKVNNAIFDKKLDIGGNYESSLNNLKSGRYQKFSSYKELLDYCINIKEDM